MKATAKAHTNIALIKYWGKRDESLILPMNNSLSLTLDGFYTMTTVEFKDDLTEDKCYLDGMPFGDEEARRISAFLDVVRHKSAIYRYAQVESFNHVPTAAGFASSASGFAALAGAAARALELDMSYRELSALTRRGSGSACRSIFGGFVEWLEGEAKDGTDSYATPIAPSNHWDIRVAGVILSDAKKEVLSREGMKRTVNTSLFYKGWLEGISRDLAEMKAGIQSKDFEKVGMIAEANCLRMHGTTLASDPPFTYWQPATMAVMETVKQMRTEGIPVYFTIDAGPNVKVLYLPENEKDVRQRLQAVTGVTDVILSGIGDGLTYR